MIQTWFKIFFRNSKKNWLNLVINILGLTLGFAGLLLVLLYLNDEESYNATNPNKNEIYRIVHQLSNGEVWASSTAVEGPKYVEDIPEVMSTYMSRGWYDDGVVTVNGKKKYTRDILLGQSTFFDFFPFQIVEGSLEQFKKARNHIALSDKQAKTFFGKKSAIGKSIELAGRVYLVTTVYKIIGKHYYMPEIVHQFEKVQEGHWGNFSYNLLIKTSHELPKTEVEKKLNTVWHINSTVKSAEEEGMSVEEFKKKHGSTVFVEPLSSVRLKPIANHAGPEGKGNYQMIMVMLSLSILLIIISCVNFINLSTASATQRAKEVGVKKTLGLSKLSLTRQYTLEIVIQGIIAFILSLILVELLLPYFNDFMRKDISILNSEILLKVGLIAVLLAFFIGSIPAFYLSNFKSIEVLKGNISRGKKGIFARNLMLGLQFIISGFFLIGSLIILKQVDYMMNKELGFSGEQVVNVWINDWKSNRYQKYSLAKKELVKHPNIDVVTSNYFMPGGGSSNSTNSDYKENSVQANSSGVDYEVIETFGLKLLKGRSFDPKIASDTIKSVIINETMAKGLGIYNDPIGKKINLGWGAEDNDGKNMNVIGMVKDYHIYGMDNKIPPIFLVHWNTFDWYKNNLHAVQLKIKPENVAETMKFVERFWKENIEQGYPFDYRFVNKQFARQLNKFEKQKTMFLTITTIVIIVSLLGLFALATLTIQQRLKEVAIRKTLGASVQEIMIELIKSFIKIVLISSVFLIPIAYYFMQNWLDDFVYRIDMPIVPYIVTPVILIILVIAVVGLKAYNATKVDLIKYLKFE